MSTTEQKETPPELTREIMKLLRSEIDDLVAGIASDFGVSIKTGRATYGPRNAEMKLEIAVIGEHGEVIDRERESFIRNAKARWGIDPEAIDLIVTASTGRAYKIIGANTRAKRYPILLLRLEDNQRVKMSAQQVKMLLPK